MNKLVLAVAAASLAFATPTFAQSSATNLKGVQLAQADVKIKVKTGESGVTRKKIVVRHRGDVTRRKIVIRQHGDVVRKKIIVRHDRGLHRGWAHSRHDGAMRTKVVVKRGPNTTIIRKKNVY
jgi:hypothetical protein